MLAGSEPPLVSPLGSIGLGLLLIAVGAMIAGVGWSQLRGRGPRLLRSRVARIVFGQEYGPRWLRSTPTPVFDQGLRIVGGSVFVVVGAFAIVVGFARL